MLIYFPFYCILVILTTLSAGCKKDTAKAPPLLPQISEIKALTFADTLRKALNTCDIPVLQKLIDINSMIEKGVRQSKAPKQDHPSIIQTIQKNAGDWARQFCAPALHKNQIQFIGQRKRGTFPTLLFREVSETSFAYNEFYIQENPDKMVRSNNVYSYGLGQDRHQSYTQWIHMGLASEAIQKEFIAFGERDFGEDPNEQYQAILALSPSLQQNKEIQLRAIGLAAKLKPVIFEEALYTFKKLFPNDPSLLLFNINIYEQRKEYEKVFEAINTLDTALGGDPFLDTIRISILLKERKDLPRATALAESYLKKNPDSEEAHYLLLGAHIVSHNFAGAVAIMRLLGERFEQVFEDEGLHPNDPDYAALKASPEWEAYRNRLDQ